MSRISSHKLILIALALFTGACDDRPSPVADPHKVVVVATVYPLADAARQIGASMAEVSWVVESGQSLANVESNTEQRNRMRTADLVLTGGLTEQWAILGFDDPRGEGRLLRLDKLPSAADATPGGLLWLDPVVMIDGCKQICTRLQGLRPQHGPALQERTDHYIAPIEALYQQYQFKFTNAQNKKLLVINDEFAPLFKRFGLQAIVAVHGSAMDISDEQISILQSLAKQNKTQLLVIRADTPSPNVKDLADRSRLQIVLLDVLGSSAAGGRNTYLDLLKFDLEQLQRATMVQ